MEEGGDGWDNQRMEEDKEETSIKVEMGKHRYTVEFQIYQVGYCTGSNWKERIETNIGMGHSLEVIA